MRLKYFVLLLFVVQLYNPLNMVLAQEYPPGNWKRIIANQDFTTPLSLDTGDDDTLIIGAVFHDIPDHAISIRNVSNVYIKDCTIYSIDGFGILLRSTGSTRNVTIDGCKIYNTRTSGIMVTQRRDQGIDHEHVVIKNNFIYNNGQNVHEHNIYVQSTDILVENNIMYGSSGNGVSIRSSGVVRNNVIWDTVKSCIRYYNDHQPGPSNTLYIENNICYLTQMDDSNHPGISLSRANTPYEWLLDNYHIRFNTVVMFNPIRYGIEVESADYASKYVAVYGNLIVNTWHLSRTLKPDFITYNSRNYLSTSLEGFVNPTALPYDFHLLTNSPARNYATGETDYPSHDLDGVARTPTSLDAGAVQFVENASPVFAPPLMFSNAEETFIIALTIIGLLGLGVIAFALYYHSIKES